MEHINELPSWVFPLFIGALGVCIGSFLNVVIYRLPRMMERQWTRDVAITLEERQYLSLVPALSESVKQINQQTFNLLVPRSHCPSCQAPVSALHNIPIISWLWLKGRCASCHQFFGVRYWIIEIFTGLLSVLIAWRFGFSWSCLAGLILCWCLIALAWIDWDTLLLPDSITLPLIWCGLLFNLYGTLTPLSSAVIGAISGYMFLWSVYWGFKYLTGKEGMGYGDFKLLAALGAFLGWVMLPMILLLASLAGAIIGGTLIALKKHSSQRPLPFGPYLAVAGIIALLWGQPMLKWYFNLF